MLLDDQVVNNLLEAQIVVVTVKFTFFTSSLVGLLSNLYG